LKKAVKTVSFMVIATMLAKVMGMVRDMFFTNYYGTGIEGVAFLSATRIPLLFFDITLGAAILSTFIPVFNRYLEKGDKKGAFDFSNSFINLVVLISVVFCIIGVVFAKDLANFIAPGIPDEAKVLATKLLIVLLPTTIFTSLAFAFVGILQSFDEFNIPAIISLVSNLAVIIYLIFLNKTFGIFGVAVAMLIGWSLQFFVQIPSLIQKGYKYRFVLNLRNEGILDVFKLAIPILISSWLQPICVMINTIFGSYLNGGQAVAGLEFANRLYIIIVGVFTFGITNYIFPSLSKMSGGGNADGFKDVMSKSIKVMLLIIAPIMLGMMLLARPIIDVVYGRGEFGETSIMLTSTALFFYSIGMVSFGINEIINKCFYAMKDGKTPMIASVCGIITTLILAFTFTKLLGLGIGGLALSASISAIVVSVMLIIAMTKKVGAIFDKQMLIYIAKVAIATLIMAIAVITTIGLASNMGKYMQLILPTFAGIVFYLPILWVLKIREIREVIK